MVQSDKNSTPFVGKLYGFSEAAKRHSTEDAVAARDNHLAIVSHELKNMLHSILLTLSLAKKKGQIGDELGRIEKVARRMERLVNDILDGARIAYHQLHLERCPGDVRVLLKETVEILEPVAEASQVQLETYLPDFLPTLVVDSGRLLQVFSNLICNGIKFTPPGGKVIIRVKLLDEKVRFSVEDTGQGISEEHLPCIFDRFWKGHDDGGKGTGLGLFIVKGIVEAHGGRVWVNSQLGKGTCFNFDLPVPLKKN